MEETQKAIQEAWKYYCLMLQALIPSLELPAWDALSEEEQLDWLQKCRAFMERACEELDLGLEK